MPISIGRGENRGQEITYHNVVRNLVKLGDWNGNSGSWTVPLETVAHDGVDAAVAFVQDGSRDKPGPMLGAAYTSLHYLRKSSALIPDEAKRRSGIPRLSGAQSRTIGSILSHRPGNDEERIAKNKKDQLALAQCVISALGPVPTIPGGWGLRNPKPKEPDQRSIFLSQL